MVVVDHQGRRIRLQGSLHDHTGMDHGGIDSSLEQLLVREQAMLAVEEQGPENLMEPVGQLQAEQALDGCDAAQGLASLEALSYQFRSEGQEVIGTEGGGSDIATVRGGFKGIHGSVS